MRRDGTLHDRHALLLGDGLDAAVATTNDVLVIIDVQSSTQFRVRRATENLGVMNGTSGAVSILIY